MFRKEKYQKKPSEPLTADTKHYQKIKRQIINNYQYQYHLLWQVENTLQTVKALLDHDKVGISATDTIPSLLTTATLSGYEQLHTIKENRKDKPFLLLTHPDKLNLYVDISKIPKEIKEMQDNLWNSGCPITWIYQAKPNLPYHIGTNNKKHILDHSDVLQTISIRHPNHSYLLRLLEEFNGLFSTSANLSETSPPQDMFCLNDNLMKKETISFLIYDAMEDIRNEKELQELQHIYQIQGHNKPLTRPSSTIIDISEVMVTQQLDTPITVVRNGIYNKDSLVKIYPFNFI